MVTYTLHLTACGQSESVPILFVDSLHAQTQSSYVITYSSRTLRVDGLS